MYCKYCGRKLDDDARFCPQCGAEVMKEKHKKKRVRKMVLCVVLCMDFLMGVVIAGIKYYQGTDSYKVEKTYKQIAEEFIHTYTNLAPEVYHNTMVCENENSIIVKADYIKDGIEREVVGIYKDGKWERTDLENTNEITELKNQSLQGLVNEAFYSCENIIAVYDKKWNLLETERVE